MLAAQDSAMLLLVYFYFFSKCENAQPTQYFSEIIPSLSKPQKVLRDCVCFSLHSFGFCHPWIPISITCIFFIFKRCTRGQKHVHVFLFFSISIVPSGATNFNHLLELNLGRYLTAFDPINEAATKEFSLEKALKSMTEAWEPVSFIFMSFVVFFFILFP